MKYIKCGYANNIAITLSFLFIAQPMFEHNAGNVPISFFPIHSL